MTWVDLLVVAVLVALVVRGWMRGLVREAIDLVALVAGLFLAFRLAGPVGGVIEGMAGTSAMVSRVVAGVVVFLAISIGAALLARAVHAGIRLLPGMPLLNRVAGAALGGAWGLLITTIVLSLMLLAPVPETVAAEIDDSMVAGVLTDPHKAPQQVIAGLAGDRVMQTMIELRRLFGRGRIVIGPGDSVSIPAAAPEILAEDEDAADRLYHLLNRSRVDAGLTPLASSPVLDAVAAAHAREMYEGGYFSHSSSATGRVGDRLNAAGIPYVAAGENLALAPTPDEAHQGLLESQGHRANLLGAAYDRVGIGVVEGPIGLVVVEVYAG